MRHLLLLPLLSFGLASVDGASSTPQVAQRDRAPIPPSELVPHRDELPGFARAHKSMWSSESAGVWAKADNGSPPVGESDLRYLRRQGFQEGVELAYLLRPHREAVASGVVLGSPQAAQQELAAAKAEVLKTFEHAHRYRFAVPAIPGSMGLGNAGGSYHGSRVVTANILFASGRCFFIVGDRIVGSSSKAMGERAPVRGAGAVYRRARRLCA